MEDLIDVLWLMDKAEVQGKFFIRDLKNVIYPPLELGQYELFYGPAGKPIGFCSWAFLTQEAREGFLDRTRPLAPLDWNAGTELWFMDFIAPYGGVREMVRQLYALHPYATVAYMARTSKENTVKRIGVFERK